jgi:hypothetical protein
MSESIIASLPTLNDAQAVALRAFVRKCERAMMSVMVIAALGMLLIIAANPLDPNNGPTLIALLVLIGLYPLVLFAVIWLRTRLGWHLLNAHALWAGMSGALIIAAFAVILSVVQVLLQGSPTGTFQFNSIFVLLLILPIFFAPAFRSSTRSRAEQERARFANHWLKLGSLPFWCVFLLLIPHERA